MRSRSSSPRMPLWTMVQLMQLLLLFVFTDVINNGVFALSNDTDETGTSSTTTTAAEEVEEESAGSSPQSLSEENKGTKEMDGSSSDPKVAPNEKQQRLWGSSTTPQANNNNKGEQANSDTEEKQQKQPHVPFLPLKGEGGIINKANYAPPEGFSISARVYIDSVDGKAHFDDLVSNPIQLPYWDCGVIGTTTSPLPLKDAFFRHALSNSRGTTWTGYTASGAKENLHPVLAVALSPIQIALDSDETKQFQAGDVILLEDILQPGHTIRPIPSSSQHQKKQDVQVLFLTLPQKHFHTGREHFSLENAVLQEVTKKATEDPCPEEHPWSSPLDPAFLANKIARRRRSSALSPQKVRRGALSVVGLSLSLFAADFLGKTAPLWLAVGVGGTCFVGGGTYSFVKIAENLLGSAEVWQEERALLNRQQIHMLQEKGSDESPQQQKLQQEVEKQIDENTSSSTSNGGGDGVDDDLHRPPTDRDQNEPEETTHEEEEEEEETLLV